MCEFRCGKRASGRGIIIIACDQYTNMVKNLGPGLTEMKARTEEAILAELRRESPQLAPEIARSTGISVQTALRYLNRMLSEGKVAERRTDGNRRLFFSADAQRVSVRKAKSEKR